MDPTPQHPPAAVGGDLDRVLARMLGHPGPYEIRPLTGGNSNETCEVRLGGERWILRRPPPHAIDPSAHSMQREHIVLAALWQAGAPVPQPLGLCEDPDVPGTPFLVMEAIDGVALTDMLPEGYPEPAAATAAIGTSVVDALAAVHLVDWSRAGLTGFGRPDGFLARQVPRWRTQLDRYRTRELPWFDELAGWLERHLPPERAPAVLHGDFHLDNCLMSPGSPVRLEAIIDWEMATIGDPLLDLGLFLAFWGEDRPDRPAMPRIQGVTRVPGAPSRAELAARYERATGRPVDDLPWYLAFAFWKLAAIVEGAYAQLVTGKLDNEYARALEHDVPALLREAAAFAELG